MLRNTHVIRGLMGTATGMLYSEYMLRNNPCYKKLAKEEIPKIPPKLVLSSYLLFGTLGGVAFYTLPVDILLATSLTGLGYYLTTEYVDMLNDYNKECKNQINSRAK